MSTETKSRNIGRKIWYVVAITLCVLVIALSTGAFAGTWVLGSTLSSATLQLLTLVENAATGAREVVGGVEDVVADVQEVTISIGEASNEISQSVADRGVVLTLLPEEREQELEAKADELQTSIDSILVAVRSGLELYLAIDNLPFISLPMPRQETLNNLEQLAADIQSTVDEILQGIQDFRDGVSSEIDRVTELTADISARLGETRENLDTLDADLAALQEFTSRLKRAVPTIFTLISLVISLFLGWVVYTQVEVIRMYVRRWQALDAPAAALPAGNDAEPQIEEGEAELEEAEVAATEESELSSAS